METETTFRSVSCLSGQGVLARVGELVLLCELAPGSVAGVGALIDTLDAVAAENSCGRELSSRVARLVGTSGRTGFPSLCAFGAFGDGLAAVVYGQARFTVDVAGEEMELDGRNTTDVVDLVVDSPVGSIRAVIGDGDADVRIDQWSKPAAVTDDRPVVAAAPTRQQLAAVSATDPDLVVGVYCRRAHFNDPRMNYCTVCGISMAQATRSPVLGKRPALGVLVLDDGTMYPLVRNSVVGRIPETDETVQVGAASPMRLDDPSVSRVHARIVLDGWDVCLIDEGSRNGSFLCLPGESWTRSPAGARAALLPGTVVAFGRRQLRYHSYRAQAIDFSSLEPVSAGK